jgi:hypothetical protein
MSTRFYKLLSNYSTESTDFAYSDKQKGSGYHSSLNATHTFVYAVDDGFVGSIIIQGTLADRPGEDDWFDIADSEFTAEDSSINYQNNAPSRVFEGNFVWLRSKTLLTDGTITEIRYNF